MGSQDSFFYCLIPQPNEANHCHGWHSQNYRHSLYDTQVSINYGAKRTNQQHLESTNIDMEPGTTFQTSYDRSMSLNLRHFSVCCGTVRTSFSRFSRLGGSYPNEDQAITWQVLLPLFPLFAESGHRVGMSFPFLQSCLDRIASRVFLRKDISASRYGAGASNHSSSINVSGGVAAQKGSILPVRIHWTSKIFYGCGPYSTPAMPRWTCRWPKIRRSGRSCLFDSC